MNPIHRLRSALVFACLAALSPVPGHAADPMSDGTVQRLNLERGTITLQHGNIPSLQMPPMTMTFKLERPELAQGLKAGDAVKFSVIEKNRDYVVTKIEAAK